MNLALSTTLAFAFEQFTCFVTRFQAKITFFKVTVVSP